MKIQIDVKICSGSVNIAIQTKRKSITGYLQITEVGTRRDTVAGLAKLLMTGMFVVRVISLFNKMLNTYLKATLCN